MSEPALWSWNSKIEKSLPILEKMLKPHFPENLQDLTVFPVKPWTPEKISGMFIVSRPIRCEMKPQKITDKPQQGSVTTWYETTSRLFLLQEIFNFPFGSLWKSYFLPQTNTSHLIPSVQKPNYRIDLNVSTNCENFRVCRIMLEK